MDSELSAYQFQLEQVTEALERDPDNQDLLKLRNDLNDLILLVSQADVTAPQPHSTTANTSSSSQSQANVPPQSQKWVKGQTILAKYTKDKKFYEATFENYIDANTAIVTFKSYGTKQRTLTSDIKDFDPTLVAAPSSSVTGGQKNVPSKTPRAFAVAFQGGDRISKKKARNEAYAEKIKSIEEEQKSKQNAWMKFAKKKGVEKRESMFSTPDDPNAKVGVIGSGKPMTTFTTRGKHVYDRDA